MNLLTAPSIAVPGATRPWHLAEPDDSPGSVVGIAPIRRTH